MASAHEGGREGAGKHARTRCGGGGWSCSESEELRKAAPKRRKNIFGASPSGGPYLQFVKPKKGTTKTGSRTAKQPQRNSDRREEEEEDTTVR